MNTNWLTTRGNCFLEFTVDDLNSYQIFRKLFDSLKIETQKRPHLEFGLDEETGLKIVIVPPTITPELPPNQVYKTVRDWLALFEPSDLAYIGLPTHEELPAKLSELSEIPDNIAEIQEQNIENLLNWFTEIGNAVKTGDPIVPLTDHMEKLGEEMEKNPAMKTYQQEHENKIDTKLSLKRLKEFVEIVDSFEDITYELETCELIAPDRARIEFFTSGFPYGGRYVLNILLRFFGFSNIVAQNC